MGRSFAAYGANDADEFPNGGEVVADLLLQVDLAAWRQEAEDVIYLDANATTPLLPEVFDAMLPWLREGYANPSGSYMSAKLARRAIDEARGQVAELIGADPAEIIFTGGGTESVNAALFSMDRLVGNGTAVVSSIEHSAVLRWVEAQPRVVTRVAVTPRGRLDMTAFERALNGAAYVSLMSANNETGVIQPLQEAAALARERGLPVHSDAIQAAGKILIDVRKIGVDMLSLSAHKFHGPKGVGALYVREGLSFKPSMLGGGQESDRRSGTENTAGIVGMGAAAVCMKRANHQRLGEMRDLFERNVLQRLTGVAINGDVCHRLSNTSHLSFEQCDAAGLLILLDEAGVACSAGSACMTGKQKPSHVQMAMGIPEAQAKSSIRFSFSCINTLEEAELAAAAVKHAVEKLRRIQGGGVGPVVIYSS
ncbi:MAG: cysteine desulfurase [Akkermansiaceae bacterium]|nr:cysteine desulfurase [Akkermansiaceae bacterium]